MQARALIFCPLTFAFVSFLLKTLEAIYCELQCITEQRARMSVRRDYTGLKCQSLINSSSLSDLN